MTNVSSTIRSINNLLDELEENQYGGKKVKNVKKVKIYHQNLG